MNMKNIKGSDKVKFSIPELSPGEDYLIDIPHVEYEKQKGYFKPYLPLDYAEIINNSSENLEVNFDNTTKLFVPNNSVKEHNNKFIRIKVKNNGEVDIPSGEVQIEVQKRPLDADKKARKDGQQGQLSRVIETFTGVRL